MPVKEVVFGKAYDLPMALRSRTGELLEPLPELGLNAGSPLMGGPLYGG